MTKEQKLDKRLKLTEEFNNYKQELAQKDNLFIEWKVKHYFTQQSLQRLVEQQKSFIAKICDELLDTSFAFTKKQQEKINKMDQKWKMLGDKGNKELQTLTSLINERQKLIEQKVINKFPNHQKEIEKLTQEIEKGTKN